MPALCVVYRAYCCIACGVAFLQEHPSEQQKSVAKSANKPILTHITNKQYYYI